jgi:hypothetical protein
VIITRQWAMPNHHTFEIAPIRGLLQKYIHTGLWLDPFNGGYQHDYGMFADCRFITNDLNPKVKADYHEEALDFLRRFDDASVDGILFDPPYSLRQAKECYQSIGIDKLTMQQTQNVGRWTPEGLEVWRLLKTGGIVIYFGWHSNGFGEPFITEEILLVPHGSAHNDTICTVQRKV